MQIARDAPEKVYDWAYPMAMEALTAKRSGASDVVTSMKNIFVSRSIEFRDPRTMCRPLLPLKGMSSWQAGG